MRAARILESRARAFLQISILTSCRVTRHGSELVGLYQRSMTRPMKTQVSNTSLPTGMPYDAIISTAQMGFDSASGWSVRRSALAIAVRRQDGRLIDSCVRTFGLLHGQNVAEQQFAFRYATPAPVQEHHVTHSADSRDVADVLREMMRDPATAAEALALSEKLTAQAFGAGATKPEGNA